MKLYKPRIKITGPYNFDDVKYLYKCSGLGYNGYGESAEESYEDWISVLRLLSNSSWVFVWINRIIAKLMKLIKSL